MRRNLIVSVVLLLAMIVSACAGAMPPAAAPAPAQPPSEPQAGGILNIWLPNGWPDQSMLHLSHWESSWAISPMVDPYFYIATDGSMQGVLADSVDLAADGLTYTMKLHPGVTFHDGTPLTAEHVIYSMLMRYSPKTRPLAEIRHGADIKGLKAYQAGEADTIEGVTQVDELTVQFTLETQNAGFLRLFFTGAGADFPYPLPKHILEGLDQEKLFDGTLDYWYTAPISTGPYKFVKYETDQYIEYARNENYWGGKVGPEKLFMKIAAPEVALVMLQKGEVDLVSPVALTEIDRLKEDPTVEILEAENVGSWWGLEMNFYTMDGLWKNPKAKQAFLYAVDRQAYVDSILRGYGKVRDSFFDGTPYACPTMTRYTYDPEKAKALLAEVGVKPEDVIVDLMSWLGIKARLDYLPIAQEYLRQIGFKANVDLIDNALEPEYTMGEGPRGKDWDFHVLWYGPGADPGSIDPWLRPGQSSNAGYRSWPGRPDADGVKKDAWYWENARVTELLDLAKVESDPTKRTAYFQEIDCIWNQELPSLTTVAASIMGAKSRRLQGINWQDMAALGQPSTFRPGAWWVWQQ